jgi:hypothetical protein
MPLQSLIRLADIEGVLLHSSETNEPRPGHTVTALDDRLTRAVGRLPMTAALPLAGAVYAGLGLALPLALGARGVLLISLNVLGVLLGLALTLAWLLPVTQAVHRRHLLEWTTHLRLLSATEFEWLVGELLRREGWEVDETGREDAADGNVDLRIRKDDRKLVVQCKRWTTNPVGVSEVRELAGTVAREQLPRGAGMLVTLSHFTGQARAEAAQLELELIDNRDLCARLERAGATDLVRRTELLQASYPCPKCATPMLLDHSPHGWWLHCPRYRDGCKGKQHLGPDPARALELLRASQLTGGAQKRHNPPHAA